MAHTKEQFSLKDNSFIAAVASSLQISSSKVKFTTTSLSKGEKKKRIILVFLCYFVTVIILILIMLWHSFQELTRFMIFSKFDLIFSKRFQSFPTCCIQKKHIPICTLVL